MPLPKFRQLLSALSLIVPTLRHLHHDANMQAFIDESLDNVLLKYRHHAKYLQVCTRLFALC